MKRILIRWLVIFVLITVVLGLSSGKTWIALPLWKQLVSLAWVSFGTFLMMAWPAIVDKLFKKRK